MCSFRIFRLGEITDEIFEFFERFQKVVEFVTSPAKNIKRNPFLFDLSGVSGGPPALTGAREISLKNSVS
jgi:hypothetical protein